MDTITPFKMIRVAGQHELITRIPKSRILLYMSSSKSDHDRISISHMQHLGNQKLMILHSPMSYYAIEAHTWHSTQLEYIGTYQRCRINNIYNWLNLSRSHTCSTEHHSLPMQLTLYGPRRRGLPCAAYVWNARPYYHANTPGCMG